MGQESNGVIQARELIIVQANVISVLAAQVLSTIGRATRTINVGLTPEEHQILLVYAQERTLTGTAASKNAPAVTLTRQMTWMGQESNGVIQARELKIVQANVISVMAAQVLSTIGRATRTINVGLTPEERQI